MNNFLIENELGYTNHHGTCNDLQKRIDQWTQDKINDPVKLNEYINDRYSRILSEKQIALNELFGVK